MTQLFLPTNFFVTSGSAQEGESELNAFDIALMNANISQCNLVEVSSILPVEAREIKPVYIAPGTITYCVMAKMTGRSGERIGAGLGWAWGRTKKGERYGLVAEHHGHTSRSYIMKKLQEKLRRMAKVRRMELSKIKTKVESVEVEEAKFGCVVVALIYTFNK
ncbi:MAG: pyruvoyl-dependent arginine decarboxylase [Thermoplasmata archaeon]|nr:pyruvoyl-dependent arginine decarboxylase [Thermoplasmata archaeon]